MHSMRLVLLFPLVVYWIILLAGCGAQDQPPVAAAAQEVMPLGNPSGPVILTIRGKFSQTNGEGVAEFDRAMLQAFPQHTIRTTTSWTDGVQEFSGVLASDLMATIGNQGSVIWATALNDYSVEIPISDFARYGVIFAITMNGKELTVKEKGPIWPIYPRDDFAELQNRKADKKWIYMLRDMEIR